MLKNYSELLELLRHRGLFRIEPGLERVQRILAELGNPQDRIPSIHIAGTNGKGSTAAAIESVLLAAGYRTGFYLSPHLVDWLERFRIGGIPISSVALVAAARRVRETEERLNIQLTHFEFLTVAAFVIMAGADCDVLVLETGMGGTWDATNAVTRPLMSVITSIGLDHTHWLGASEREIAQQKCGIIKAGVPVVSGVRGGGNSVVRRSSRERGSRLLQLDREFSAVAVATHWRLGYQCLRYQDFAGRAREYNFGLLGLHQVDNAALALSAIAVLREAGWSIPERAVRHGLRHVQWPGRFQLLRPRGSPPLLLDGAHNPHAMRRFLQTLAESPFANQPKTFIFSAYRDKDYLQMAAMIAPWTSRLYLSALPGQRGLTLSELRNIFPREHFPVHLAGSPTDALRQARRDTPADGVIIGTGSLALIGMLLQANDSFSNSRIQKRMVHGATHARH